MRNIKTITFFVAISLILSFVMYSGIFPSTQAFNSSDGIAELKQVELGGINQWISIRGENRTNPVLLWLHGGPGLAQMPLSHYVDGELEKEYVVVHWDQRGAGKTNPFDFDESTMSEEQFLLDAYELVQYLQEYLGQEKIFLLGHSWGSKLGIELVSLHPEEFHAYISVTQIVDINEGLEISYEWLRHEIEERHDYVNRIWLEKIGAPPYTTRQYKAFASILLDYGGSVDMSREELIAIAMQSQEYTFLDYFQWVDGFSRHCRPMWERSDEFSVNYREKIQSVDIPIYFFAGRNDYTTPTVLIEEYFEKIQAPEKEFVLFENSAHTPFLGETEKFQNEVIRIKGEIL